MTQETPETPRNYEELTQLWGIDIESLKKARTKAELVEGVHFIRKPEEQGRLYFTSEGQDAMAKALGIAPMAECSDLGSEHLEGGSEHLDIPETMGEAMASQFAYPAAIAFFQHFPAAVAREVRRMIQSPSDEEKPIVYGAMQLAMGAATDPKGYLEGKS